MPTWLLKLCVSELLPIITAIVNVSMDSCRVPLVFKCAQIWPLLKKPTPDPDILKIQLSVHFQVIREGSIQFHLVNSNSTSNLSIPIQFQFQNFQFQFRLFFGLIFFTMSRYSEYLLGIHILSSLYSK